MRTINVLPVEELESSLIEKQQFVYVVITSHEDMDRVDELCSYYGYMVGTTGGINVLQLVMRVSDIVGGGK